MASRSDYEIYLKTVKNSRYSGFKHQDTSIAKSVQVQTQILRDRLLSSAE